MELAHAYAFIGGAVVGKFGGILASSIVGGVLLYVADPTVFNYDTVDKIRCIIMNIIH